MRLFAIGHSAHPIGGFLGLLARRGIEALADIRRFPDSRKYQRFSRDRVAPASLRDGVEYRWFEALGGRRKKGRVPPRNFGFRNEVFRNCSGCMATREFHDAVGQLLAQVRRSGRPNMCSEGLCWRRHRRLFGNYLPVRGLTIHHILSYGELRPHTLTEGPGPTAGK